jgi:hypothetical protein
MTRDLRILTCCLLIGFITCTIVSADQIAVNIESDHPYANNFKYKWPEINQTNATQMRLHFTVLDIPWYDHLYLLDKDGATLKEYENVKVEDYWSDWYTGNVTRLMLVTDGSKTAEGFKVDKIETRNDPISLAPSSSQLTKIGEGKGSAVYGSGVVG